MLISFLCVCLFKNSHQKCSLLYETIARGLQKIRNKGVPKAPSTAHEIKNAFDRPDIFEFYGKTDHSDSREILFDNVYDGNDFAYCIFSSKKIIGLIEKHIPVKERNYLIDATFSIVPYGCFSQLLIIHVAKFDTVHPFTYVLMSKKSQIAYTHVFKYINNHIFNLTCDTFTTDYEKAMKNALRSCFPSSKLVSCWFHYTQAIRKKVSK